jgi:hypothetical protein
MLNWHAECELVVCGEMNKRPTTLDSRTFHVQETDACGFGGITVLGDLCSSWSAYQLWNRLSNLCPAEAGLRGPGSGLLGSRSSARVCSHDTATDLRPARTDTRVCAALARSHVCAAFFDPWATVIGSSLIG